MTRQKYRDEAKKLFTFATAPALVDERNFILLLKDVAIELFIRQTLTTDFAKETRRRLRQLEEQGFTDP